jgi:hypothetical protein
MSQNKCCLCFEELNVPEYRENTTGEPIIEGNTTRLECGHAYHSSCVIQMMRSQNCKCAMCNNIHIIDSSHEYDSWTSRIAFEGKCMKALASIKKEEEIREGIRDVKAFRKEIDKKRKEFDKRVLESKRKIAEELEIDKTIDLYEFSMKEILKRFRKKAKDSGSLELAAITKLSDMKIKDWFFGCQHWHLKFSYTKRFFFGR